MEKEFHKALVIEYVKNFCAEHNLSLQKLQTQRFTLSGHECAFAKPIYVNFCKTESEISNAVNYILKDFNGKAGGCQIA